MFNVLIGRHNEQRHTKVPPSQHRTFQFVEGSAQSAVGAEAGILGNMVDGSLAGLSFRGCTQLDG